MPQNGVIVIEIDQTLLLERQAFNAHLGIAPRATLTDVTAQVEIRDSLGNDASDKFFVVVDNDPNGGTIAGPTNIDWQLIPNAGAGGSVMPGQQVHGEGRPFLHVQRPVAVVHHAERGHHRGAKPSSDRGVYPAALDRGR